jgi:putative FmdB family regulatory protein
LPIYEYECACCASRFEIKRSFDDSSPVSCPNCGSKAERIFVSVPIIFKGSGFYITDHRGNNSAAEPAEKSDDKAKVGSTDKAKVGSTDKAKVSRTEASSKETGSPEGK